MKVGLIAYNWEADTSLALWNLITYAKREPLVAAGVEFSTYCSATPKSGSEEEKKLFEVLDWIRDGNFDVLGFSCYIWNIKFVNRIAQAVKELWPDVLIVFGGQQIRGFYVRQVFERERCVDLCVVDEAEVTFQKLLRNLLTGEPKLSQIRGLAYLASADDKDQFYKLGDGEASIPAGHSVHQTGEPEIVDEINDIPSPYLGEIDLAVGGAFLYEASRGCPYKCSFCIWGESKGVREYPMERVEAELRNILRHQPSHIMFCDGTFNMRKERAAKILGILVDHLREGIAKPFSLLLELKLEIIDDRLAKVMDELIRLDPLVTIEFGLQSSSQEAAEKMRRPFSEEKFRGAWNRLSPKLKSSAILDCIYGLPGDGIPQFKDTVDFCYSLAPHRIQCFRLSILPGSEFERQAEEFKLKFMREPNHMVYRTEWVDLDDMAWLEAFGFAVADLYHFHGNTIKCLLGQDSRRMKFSELITEFVTWAGRDAIMASSYGGNRPEGRWRAIDLSSLFEEFVFQIFLPRIGVNEEADLARFRDLMRYESILGKIAVHGLRGDAVGVEHKPANQEYLYAHAQVFSSRFDIPDFIIKARGKTEINIREMEETGSHIALTQRAGHQEVRVPISYRISDRVAVILERFKDGQARRDFSSSGDLPLIEKLRQNGLLVGSAP